MNESPITNTVAAAYRIPTDQPEADGTISWSATVLVVVRVQAAGQEGLGWTYCSSAAATLISDVLAGVVAGRQPFDVAGLNHDMLSSCRNIGQPGIAACAISALDVALWDLKARLLELPLSRLIGRAVDEVPIYGSGGFTTYDDATTTSQLEQWVSAAIPRVKIKIGESWGRNERRDLHRVELAREVVGEDTGLFVDANGAYSRKQAVRLGRVMDEAFGVVWFEEPVSSDDLAGLREVRDQCRIDVAAGEYGYSPWYFAPMIDAGAVDCIQADVTRCGGITGWLAVSNLTAAHHLDISGHCAPNLHAHVAVAAANLRHLEYFHDHVRIEDSLFEGTLVPHRGALRPRDEDPGHGMVFKAADAETYRIA